MSPRARGCGGDSHPGGRGRDSTSLLRRRERMTAFPHLAPEGPQPCQGFLSQLRRKAKQASLRVCGAGLRQSSPPSLRPCEANDSATSLLPAGSLTTHVPRGSPSLLTRSKDGARVLLVSTAPRAPPSHASTSARCGHHRIPQTMSWENHKRSRPSALCLETLPGDLPPGTLVTSSFLQEAFLNLPLSWAHAWTPRT